MNFTESNINNRTVLARCCYADMIIDMMEASASGDKKLYDCMKKKAWMLKYSIDQMCEYLSENMFGQNIAEEPIIKARVLTSTSTFADAATAGAVNVGAATLGGVNLITPGTVLTTVATTWGQVMSIYSSLLNNYTQSHNDGIYYFNANTSVNSDGNVVSNVTIYYDSSIIGLEPAYSITTSPAHPATVFTLNYSDLTTSTSWFSNNMARKFLNQMDEYCGCPCGDNSNVTNDTLPKYI